VVWWISLVPPEVFDANSSTTARVSEVQSPNLLEEQYELIDSQTGLNLRHP
jgi:hypothetical protein